MQAITNVPNLLLIGAPKCGTTSLLYWMRQHPEIFHPWSKMPISASESGFLIGGIADLPYSPTKPIGTLLLPNEINFDNYKKQKWIIDKSPLHLYSANALNLVTNFLPNSKVVITIRDPLDLFISWHGEMSKGLEYNVSLSELVERLEEEDWEANIENSQTWSFRTYPSYSKSIYSWIENLGQDRVRIIKLNTIANNPRQVLDSLSEWLEIDPIKMPTNLTVKNQGGKLSENPLRKILRRPPKFIFIFARILLPSRRIRKIILDPIRRMGWKYIPTEKETLSPNVEEKIKKIFSEDVNFFHNIEDFIPSSILIK